MYLVSLVGNTSLLSADFVPQQILKGPYYCGLSRVSFYNTIPNIEEAKNNMLHLGDNFIYEIPEGAYEVKDIAEFFTRFFENQSNDENYRENYEKLSEKSIVSDSLGKDDVYIKIEPNTNTSKCRILSNAEIDFTQRNSIGPTLGFAARKLEKCVWHQSDSCVDINPINIVRVQCNIISGSFCNGASSHTIYEFNIDTPVGFKVVENPSNILYLPVNTNELHTITVSLVDENGSPINLRGEKVAITLYLKPASELDK